MGDPSAAFPTRADPSAADHLESGRRSDDLRWACLASCHETHPTRVGRFGDDRNRSDPNLSDHRANGHCGDGRKRVARYADDPIPRRPRSPCRLNGLRGSGRWNRDQRQCFPSDRCVSGCCSMEHVWPQASLNRQACQHRSDDPRHQAWQNHQACQRRSGDLNHLADQRHRTCLRHSGDLNHLADQRHQAFRHCSDDGTIRQVHQTWVGDSPWDKPFIGWC